MICWKHDTHVMRNEMHVRIKRLHRPVQSSDFVGARELKYLFLLETWERWRTLSCQFPKKGKTRCASRGWHGER